MITKNAITALQKEMDWLQKVIDQVICRYLLQEGHENHWSEIPMPAIDQEENVFYASLKDWNLNIYERLCLALIIAPQLKPEILDVFFWKKCPL